MDDIICNVCGATFKAMMPHCVKVNKYICQFSQELVALTVKNYNVSLCNRHNISQLREVLCE